MCYFSTQCPNPLLLAEVHPIADVAISKLTFPSTPTLISCRIHHIKNVSDSSLMKQMGHLFSINAFQLGEPDSSVNIVSGYGLDDRAIEVRFPAEAKGFFL
jgi:hypothetical protein